MKTKTPTAAAIPLPKGITAADSKWRTMPQSLEYGTKKYDAWQEHNKLVDPRELVLYYTERFGWIITTLHISNAPRRSTTGTPQTPRTYGIDLKGNVVTVGAGPHVKRTLRVLIHADRLADLQPYVDLYNKGMEDASNIRDRISTRRAQTQLRRGSGFNYF